ncbi:hypothetical protein MMC21_004149 [Puttea exsequens]|nr:hypothetical protein [Puttea exsequens]
MTATTLLYSQYLQTLSSSTPKKLDPPTIPMEPATPTTIPPSNPTTSPLLALPLELRLEIYTHALAIHKPTSPKTPTTSHTPLFTNHICTALLLVNRQIYHEARTLPFTANTFVFAKCFSSSVFSAKKFLGRLAPSQRSLLRNIEVAVAGREVVEPWRREDGWEAILKLLAGCQKIHVRVSVQEGDVWVAEDEVGGQEAWLANGGNVTPSFMAGWGFLVPIRVTGRDGGVKRLIEGVERAEGVELEVVKG